MNRVRIIVISSVRPEPTSAGQIVLHRHLVDQPEIDLEVYGFEPKKLTARSVLRRLVGQLKKVGLARLSEAFWVLWKGKWLDEQLPSKIEDDLPTVVLTVAHGDVCQAARRFARLHSLPMVVWFQDWWPDCARIPSWFHGPLERQYRGLYQDANLAISVCDGMRNELGDHRNSIVLHDLAAESDEGEPHLEKHKSFQNESSSFKVLYFGNLSEYGPMLEELMKATLKNPEVRLEVRGANPSWDSEFAEAMRREGRLLPFTPRSELNDWLKEADAFVVPMVFDPEMRRRMETSFPSKLIEFAQFGKPLIVWGPDYCSAGRGDYVLHLTDSDPSSVCQNLIELVSSPTELVRLSSAAQKAARTVFDPKMIRQRFFEATSGLTRGK